MLKLEKTKDAAIAIRMRTKEKIFEPILLKALAIALIFHFGALLLIHVTPFSFTSSYIFPPVSVQSDGPIAGVSTLVSYEDEVFDIPPPLLSFIPSLDSIIKQSESPLTPTLRFDAEALQSLEQRVWPRWKEPLTIPLEEPRIQLSIGGDLARLPLIKTDPLIELMQPFSPNNHPKFVTYRVQLDEKSGDIFWYERSQTSGLVLVDRLTEQILLNLRFKVPSDETPVSGTLDFVVLTDANDD